MELFETIQNSIIAVTGCTQVTKIARGYSFDHKYLLEGGDGRDYILRITPLTPMVEPARKEEEYHLIEHAGRYSSCVPRTYSFGVACDEGLCYMLLDYIHGVDGEEAIPLLSRDEQYRIGLAAGRELLNLHRMKAPRSIGPWRERFSAKYARKCAVFDEMQISTGRIDMEHLADYIAENEGILACPEQSFLHDDYHPANLIVADGRLHGIIDFNRHDWGDPMHDFVKLASFSSAVSIPFAVGPTDG